MWTGDIQSGYPTQWALNPSAYQNLPNEQVDWATLAQQWIKMKETFPLDQIPPAPPPPSIKADIEAGEAPMDMSKDEVTPTPTTTAAPQDGGNWGNWNNWQQWNWGWGGSAAGSSATVPADKTAAVPPYSYTPSNVTPSYPAEMPTTTFDYNHGATVPETFEQQGYWSGGPTPFLRNKSADWRADSRGSTTRRPSSKVEEVVEPDTTTLLDAAKRKQLPAWIREGLEKMEREKQKKLERERMLKEREEEMLRRKQEEEEALAAGIPVKSKFDTDSEESEKETEEVPVKTRRSRFDTTSSSPVPPKPASPPPPVKRKTREELMQDVMQQVRYILTDILMSVTNEEMKKIAEEVLADYRAKAPATQLRKTPALTSLTGKLGLGIYDTDSEDSSSESDTELPAKKENGLDSDEELRERINRKRQEFARIERDIEYQVEQQEEREREREQKVQEDEEEPPEEKVDKGQVEPKQIYLGTRSDMRVEEPLVGSKHYEQNNIETFTPEQLHKSEKESSEEQTEDSDQNSSSKSDSSSSSSSSSGREKSRKSKRKKEKKSSKKKRRRSSSKGSDRRKSSSHRKSSRRYEDERRHRYEYSHSRSRSRSRSRGHYEEYRRKKSPSYRRHSSESSHKRRHHSYSHSPDYSRGKKSSHRSRD